MKKNINFSILLVLLFSTPSFAQVKSDKSLGLNSSIVLPRGVVNTKNVNLILGGKKSKGLLFHSFDRFSVKLNDIVLFSPDNDVKTIITRVTEQKSVLNGFVGIDGNQNLVFVNPRGITFGEGFQSGISGSLTFATASKLEINDSVISTLNKNIFLSEKVSQDSQIKYSFLKTNLGKIIVKDTPSQLIQIPFVGFVSIPEQVNNIPSGLVVSANKKISIFSDEILLNNGIISTFGGDIELVSVRNGEISQSLSGNNKTSSKGEYGKIRLNSLSNIINLNDNGNSISLVADDVSFTKGSLISSFSSNPFQKKVGSIDVFSNLLFIESEKNPELFGVTGPIRSGILSNAEFGQGSNINVEAKTIDILGSSGLLTRSINSGNGGNINLKGIDTLNIIGGESAFGSSGIGTTGLGQGKTGSIDIKAKEIILLDSASIQANNFNGSEAGDIFIEADDITIAGINQFIVAASLIQTNSFSKKIAGDIDIEANSIFIADGGGIGSTTQNGTTGNVKVKANSIILTGLVPGTINITRLYSSVQEQEEAIQQIFNFTPEQRMPDGNASSLKVIADSISVSNNAEISVRNDGIGDAGNLDIRSDRLVVESNGQVIAATRSGNGGDIFIDSKLLQLRDSSILSSAQGQGTGGNINIDASLTALDSTSKIQANAENNTAGNIFLNTDTFLAGIGTEVTTTSNLGPQFNGTIEANIQNPKPSPPVRLATLNQVNLKLSQLCGYDGNSVSRQGTGFGDEIISDPKLLKGFDLKRRMELVNQFKIRDPDTGEVKPFKRLLGVKDMGNGKGKWIFDPKDAPELQSLLSFLERKCEGYAQSAS